MSGRAESDGWLILFTSPKNSESTKGIERKAWKKSEMQNLTLPPRLKIPWMEEPGRLQSMGSQRVGHDWATSFSFCSLNGHTLATTRPLLCCSPPQNMPFLPCQPKTHLCKSQLKSSFFQIFLDSSFWSHCCITWTPTDLQAYSFFSTSPLSTIFTCMTCLSFLAMNFLWAGSRYP